VPLLNNFRRPVLCYVTDRHGLVGATPSQIDEALLHSISGAVEAGIDWIQIREKDLSGRGYVALTLEALQRSKEGSRHPETAPYILVNDRLDVAIAAQAGGVHLGENSLSVGEAKRLLFTSPEAQTLRDNFLVGVSCHSIEGATSAASGGADYVFFGPVFATPSKAQFGEPQGLKRLAEVCGSVSIPVLAIGGITLENAASCLNSGASGIAAIRLFQDARDACRLASVIDALRKLTS
jgi:thiamine-phosphate pyrophosphorylase